MPDASYDILVIGGGVVGLATALEFTRRFPDLRLAVLEKESSVARHQSGRNSGVIHSGLYYRPGSLKAKLCAEGARAMIEFCREHQLPHAVCGKLVVATEPEELPRLEELYRRGQANGVSDVRKMSPDEIREVEPHARGLGALHIASTGVTDYAQVCHKYSDLISRNGAEVRTATLVTRAIRGNDGITVETATGALRTKYLINCAGLHADRVARMCGVDPGISLVPFRGEYYDLVPPRQSLVRSLIYPVPDPRFPFLGPHFTRRVDGSVDAGPNAVFAFSREGYRKTDVNLQDSVDALTAPGFWKLGRRYWQTGLGEMYRSWRKPAFVRWLQRLLPEIQSADLVPSPSGVRAQALRPDGSLLDDFLFVPAGNMLHVLNVPSPAATASLAISREIVNMAQSAFSLPASARVI